METSDKEKIRILMEDGFKVVIRDIDGKSFSKRYTIYQPIGFSELKRVIIDDNATVIGLQG